MFDEVVLRFNLGCKILVGHLVVCRLGQDQTQSIVAISQSLDKVSRESKLVLLKGNQEAFEMILKVIWIFACMEKINLNHLTNCNI